MPAGSTYCIREGMVAGPLRNLDLDADGRIDHVCFSVRNQFLHPGHPLGWIRSLTVTIDGTTARSDDLSFVLRGQWIAVQYMPTVSDIWWHMRERAEIYVRSQGVRAGPHRVDIAFDLSLQMHTPAVDRDDIWPALRQSLSVELVTENF